MSQEKVALSPRVTKILKGMGIAGAGGLVGGGIGYAGGKHRYEPVSQEYGDPMGQSLAFVGPRHAVDDLSEGIEEAQAGELGPAEMQQLLEEAQMSGVNLKTANDRGRIRARSFLKEAAKLGSSCALKLRESGYLSKEAAAPFIRGTYDLQKLAQIFRAVGVAARLEDVS